MSATPRVSPATEHPDSTAMFIRILTSGLLAGAAAGLVAALMQFFFVQPVLLHAELYESGQLLHFGPEPRPSAHQDVGGFDPRRDGLSVLFTMLIYTGYAIVVIALMSLAELRGAQVNGRTGLIWGAAGFLVVHLAPGFGLAPELPGAAAGDLTTRQVWWVGTVLATGIAVWLIAFTRSWFGLGAAVALLLTPHLIGVPEPDSFQSPAPSELGALFVARAYGAGLAAWVVAGSLAGFFWSRAAEGTGQTADRKSAH